ncbi:MAG: hypothetical protein M3N18_03905 [Actinomycetota bacterium]|nr:hypothetical protein [Actinomycetota bacterium]
MRRDLRDRLERLERRMPPPHDPPSAEERERAYEISVLHFAAWLEGGTLEDVPEQHRDAETWSDMEEYGPVLLWMEEEGFLGGGGELPAADADLDPADGYPDVVDGRPGPPAGDASGELP